MLPAVENGWGKRLMVCLRLWLAVACLLASIGAAAAQKPGGTLFVRPLHPYTQALMAAVPVPDPSLPRGRKHVMGDVPSPINHPSGCHFHPRCPRAEARCRVEEPLPRQAAMGHLVACHRA